MPSKSLSSPPLTFYNPDGNGSSTTEYLTIPSAPPLSSRISVSKTKLTICCSSHAFCVGMTVAPLGWTVEAYVSDVNFEVPTSLPTLPRPFRYPRASPRRISGAAGKFAEAVDDELQAL